MEFTQYNCPVCGERFKNGDDVVVCPDCGTPHHRECYEKNGDCFYSDKHKDGFNFDSPENSEDTTADEEPEGVVKCPRCQAENDRTSFYCNTCGFPLNSEDRTNDNEAGQQANQQADRTQGVPFGFGTAGNPMYDPLAGLNSEDEIAENVKVGEAAKFIGKSTPYYLTMFSRIKKFNSARFNFSAFIFSGAFFIYRKMYVPGIIMSLALIGITVGSTCITMANPWMYDGYSELLTGITSNTLGIEKTAMLFVSGVLNLLRLGIMVFSGLSANKLYYRHCAKRINKIKNEHNDSNINNSLESGGGVNLPMAISFFASFAVIYELCNLYLFSIFG